MSLEEAADSRAVSLHSAVDLAEEEASRTALAAAVVDAPAGMVAGTDHGRVAVAADAVDSAIAGHCDVDQLRRFLPPACQPRPAGEDVKCQEASYFAWSCPK